MTLFETPTDTVLRLILIVRYLCYNICYLWWKYCFQCARISSFIGIGNDSIRWKMWSINSISLLSTMIRYSDCLSLCISTILNTITSITTIVIIIFMISTTSFVPIFSWKYLHLSYRHNEWRYFCNCDILTVKLKNIDYSDNGYW